MMGLCKRQVPGGAQEKVQILHMLVEKAMEYEKTSYRGLFNFVRYIEKLQKYEVDFGEVNLADAGNGAVQIMTIHKVKDWNFQSCLQQEWENSSIFRISTVVF